MSGQIVYVAATSPLTVRETATSTPVPAKVVRGSSYTPSVADPVLAVFAKGVYYIVGGA